MKTKILIFTILCLAVITACEKDGSLITVSGFESSDLMTSETDIILTQELADVNVLAISWKDSTLSLSNDSMSIPSSIPKVKLEVSASSDFDSYTTITPTGRTYSFTGAVLNTLGKNLGFEADVSSPMYFRINSALGVNTESLYSNVITVNVTCYTIDMSTGFILDKETLEDTGYILYSPMSDGEYFGFTGVTAWYNWYFLEGDGTRWGTYTYVENEGEDPKGVEFQIMSDQEKQWNLWYPENGGCYYTTLNTSSKEWTATYIPSLKISGDVEAEMTFVRNEVKWYVSLTTTMDNAKVKVSSDSVGLYNITTTEAQGAVPIQKSIGFIPATDSTLSIDWNSASAGDITFATAGDYTLTFYLADPKKWTFEITEGATVIIEPISEFLYLPGIDDGISGSWTFDNYLHLTSEDDSTYAGVINVNSLYGYKMGLTLDDWADVYTMGATEGILEYNGPTNIVAPDPGLYLIQADLKNLTYSHTAITSLSYAGFNDDWTMVEMTESGVAGVYTSSVTIDGPSPWGAKLYLNGGWDYWYGGNSGDLAFKGNGIPDDTIVAAGTYDLVADIQSQTYVLLGAEVYITGLNDVWDFTTVVLSKSSSGVYTGTATINTPSPWGIQIHVDQSWNRFFGGSFDSLEYLGDNITDDQSLPTGTYDVTVDFINNTCSFVAQ